MSSVLLLIFQNERSKVMITEVASLDVPDEHCCRHPTLPYAWESITGNTDFLPRATCLLFSVLPVAHAHHIITGLSFYNNFVSSILKKLIPPVADPEVGFAFWGERERSLTSNEAEESCLSLIGKSILQDYEKWRTFRAILGHPRRAIKSCQKAVGIPQWDIHVRLSKTLYAKITSYQMISQGSKFSENPGIHSRKDSPEQSYENPSTSRFS